MLRLSLRTLLTPSRSLPPSSIFLTRSRSRSLSPYSILIAQCSTISPPHFTYPHSHNDPDPRNVRVGVWWDVNTCNLPSGLNVFRGAQAITAAIESSGIKGPIQIKAFGDMLRLARTDQEALSSTASTAIDFTPIPHGGVHRSLSADLINWVSENAAPAHLFLISCETEFSSIFHRLRMRNYNILLAGKASDTHVVLRSAATIFWDWDTLVRGENLSGKYYNKPPGGSWYGQYEGPVVDPFTEIERPELRRSDSKSVAPEFFSHDSFWRDLQSFLNTDLGSVIIAESRTRGNMAYNLQNYGPSVLRSVPDNDVLRIVDILIIEKKWVLESPHLSIPFKLTPSAGITSLGDAGDAQGSKGLPESGLV